MSLLRSSPQVRAAALHLSAVYKMTYQQALGGLVLLAEFDAVVPRELTSVIVATFGDPWLRNSEDARDIEDILESHGLLLPERNGVRELDFTEESDE